MKAVSIFSFKWFINKVLGPSSTDPSRKPYRASWPSSCASGTVFRLKSRERGRVKLRNVPCVAFLNFTGGKLWSSSTDDLWTTERMRCKIFYTVEKPWCIVNVNVTRPGCLRGINRLGEVLRLSLSVWASRLEALLPTLRPPGVGRSGRWLSPTGLMFPMMQ